MRIALEQAATRRWIAGRVGAGAVLVHIQQSVLGVVRREPEAAQTVGVAETKPVVWRSIADEVRDGRVEVAAVVNHEHVVDEIIDIHEHFVSGIARAVGVVALDLLIRGVGGKAVDRHLP